MPYDRKGLLVSLVLVMVTPAALSAQVSRPAVQGSHNRQAATAPVKLYGNLGRHHYSVTTRNPLAQRYFDQGLRLLWAFNHPEAIRSFEEAEKLDPRCAMCAWGTAYAAGPNINLPMDSASNARAWQAVKRAMSLRTQSTPRERALIEALSLRYAGRFDADRARLDSAYEQAMRGVANRFTDDREVQVLHADAIMNLAPWNYWNADGSERPGTSTLLQRLERVLASDKEHPGACHLYIHAVEARDPARGLPCAERLASLVPGAGHLVHMPGHIYIRIGRYADAIKVNRHAVHVDGELLENAGVARRGIYANGYYPHNWHFMSFAATMAGNSRLAIEASRETAKRLDANAVRAVPWVESVTPIVPLTLVTFGHWKEVLAEPMPGADMPFKLAMTWYARGVAHAALGDVERARAAVNEVQRAAKRITAGDNAQALLIARHALEGEIAFRQRRPAAAIAAFTEAMKLEDALTYNEPPTWYYPIRHSLGKVLLAANRPSEAERVYREDLVRFPENGWSLFGLAKALDAQQRTREADAVRVRFRKAWEQADVQLGASRF